MSQNATYVDIDLSFEAHPITKDIMKVTDVRAIMRSLHLLVRTAATEIVMEPEIFGSIDHLLFRGNNSLTVYNIKNRVTEVIREHEPRIELKDVEVYTVGDTRDQELFVRVIFFFLNKAEEQTVDIKVRRMR